jgi:hypothetical protein
MKAIRDALDSPNLLTLCALAVVAAGIELWLKAPF